MRENYTAELERMRNAVILMGELAVEMFDLCADMFEKENAASVGKLNMMRTRQEAIEKEIEKNVTTLITLQQPVSKETREIIGAVRISANWRKIGSHITDIALYSETCSANLKSDELNYNKLIQIKTAVFEMLTGAVSAYKMRKPDEAIKIAERDDEIDDVLKEIQESLSNESERILNKSTGNSNELNDPNGVVPSTFSLCSLIIAEHIERIGDHAADICEEIVYLERYEFLKLN